MAEQDLVQWWADREGVTLGSESDQRAAALHLYRRLGDGLNPPERMVLTAYATRYGTSGFDLPALVPQVYLHYDPYSSLQRGRKPGPLARQRMDFLLLLPNRRRVVLEVDGMQHYSDDGTASPKRYAEMVREDRMLRLAGYEVYRFGGTTSSTHRPHERCSMNSSRPCCSGMG